MIAKYAVYDWEKSGNGSGNVIDAVDSSTEEHDQSITADIHKDAELAAALVKANEGREDEADRLAEYQGIAARLVEWLTKK